MSRVPGLTSGHLKGLIVSVCYPCAVCPVLNALDKDEQNRHNPGLQEMYTLVGPETVNKFFKKIHIKKRAKDQNRHFPKEVI